MEFVADAIQRHVDKAHQYMGLTYNRHLQPWLEGTKGKAREKALDEFEEYYRRKEGGDKAGAASLRSAMSAPGKNLIDRVENAFSATGKVNAYNNVKVRDAATGDWRPIRDLGKDYFPRVLKGDVEEVLRNPAADPAKFKELAQDLLANGNIRALAEAKEYVRDVVSDETSQAHFKPLENRVLGTLNTAATGLQLGNWITSLNNLVGGTGDTTWTYGTRASLKALLDLRNFAKNRREALDLGIMSDLEQAVYQTDDSTGGKVRAVSDKLLKVGGYNLVERFNRTHNFAAAKAFARQFERADARSRTGAAARQYRAFFERNDYQPDALLSQLRAGGGAELDRFYRGAVHQTQFGYRLDQVPLWADSDNGRFFFKYGKWGLQQTRALQRNALEPLLGRRVEIDGKSYRARPNIAPLLTFLASGVLAGEGVAYLKSQVLGKDRKDKTLQEMTQDLSADGWKFIHDIASRGLNDLLALGSLGVITTPLQNAKDFSEQSHVRDPLHPPGLAGIESLIGLVNHFHQQGWKLTDKDLWDAGSGVSSQIRVGRQMGLQSASRMGLRPRAVQRNEADNDVRLARAAAVRFAEATGLDQTKASRAGGDIRSVHAADYYEIKQALLIGEDRTARQLAQKLLRENPKMELRAVQASIRASQPIRVGSSISQADRLHFLMWADKNLPSEDVKRIRRVNAAYRNAAAKAGLMTGGD